MYSGVNNYYVGIDNLTNGGQPDFEIIDEIVADCRSLNVNVLRAWAFNDHDTTVSPWWTDVKASRLQTAVDGTVYQRDGSHGGSIDAGVDYFRGLDYLLHRAGEAGIRVILPLTNNWQDYGGMAQYVCWSTGQAIPNADGANSAWRAYKNGFYTDSGAQNLYRGYISYLANRVNTYSGRTYRTDPTILAWQLANEPRMATYSGGSHAALDAWIADTAAFLADSVGVEQLVAVGLEGFYDDAASNSAAGLSWGASEGTDYIANHNHESVDVAGFHLWQQDWSTSDTAAVKWIVDHIRAARGAELARPVVMDEMGYRRGDDVSRRDARFKAYFGAAYRNMASGVNVWSLYDDARPDYDGYGVYEPADATTVDVIRRHGAKVAFFNATGVHQLVAFEYDLDGFVKISKDSAADASVERVESPTWFATDDGAAAISFSAPAGTTFAVGAELTDDLTGSAGVDVSDFGYNCLLARAMVEDNASFDAGELSLRLYDKTGADWVCDYGPAASITEPGRWYELVWDASAAGDLADLKELGIEVSALGDCAGRIYVDFIGGDLTDLLDNTPALAGDADGDGFVDDDDLSLLLANWGRDVGWEHGNFNGDGIVDDDDLSLLLANWTGGGPVPEPCALAAMSTALWALFIRRRRPAE